MTWGMHSRPHALRATGSLYTALLGLWGLELGTKAKAKAKAPGLPGYPRAKLPGPIPHFTSHSPQSAVRRPHATCGSDVITAPYH